MRRKVARRHIETLAEPIAAAHQGFCLAADFCLSLLQRRCREVDIAIIKYKSQKIKALARTRNVEFFLVDFETFDGEAIIYNPLVFLDLGH